MSLRERLAALEHEQWAHWTRHFVDHVTPENLVRWRRQCATPYAELSEAEKAADREWADRVLRLLEVPQAARDGQIAYEGRQFVGVENYDDGELTRETRFRYRQQGSAVWLTYEGGGVAIGTGVGTVDACGNLELRFQHVNRAGEFTTGSCQSRLEVMPDGRYRLHETWRTDQGQAGKSIVEEVGGGAGE